MNTSILSCSVALCTYNGEKYVSELLDSILSQIYLPKEIIIVDDGSSDSTLPILEEYAARFPLIKLIPQKSNSGPVKAFQKAIQLSDQPYIFLADQDDIWLPHKILTMLEVAVNLPSDKPCLVFSDLEVMDESGGCIHGSFWKMAALEPTRATFKSMMYGNVVTGCASLINSKMRELLREIPSGALMHDHWIALIAYGIGNVAVLDQQLLKYRVHGNSVTEKSEANFIWKIKRQVSQILDRDSVFLEKEMKQISAFDQAFGHQLTNEKQKQVAAFLRLRNQSLARKKLAGFFRFQR